MDILAKLTVGVEPWSVYGEGAGFSFLLNALESCQTSRYLYVMLRKMNSLYPDIADHSHLRLVSNHITCNFFLL